MALWKVTGTMDNGADGTVLIDSVSMLAFGPVFDSAEQADAFSEWACERFGYLGISTFLRACTPRRIDDLLAQFREERAVVEGGSYGR